ncbi:hypothetical protein LG293_17810 (plasmid) [Citricoccus nitrophenolicus]
MTDQQPSTPSPAPRPSRQERANLDVQDFLYSTKGNLAMGAIFLILIVSFVLVAIGL